MGKKKPNKVPIPKNKDIGDFIQGKKDELEHLKGEYPVENNGVRPTHLTKRFLSIPFC